MALSTVITGFYTVAELRSVIGKPTADTADPGYIADVELERIIQRHHDEAVEHARKIAHELIMRGDLPCEKRSFTPVAISVSPSSNQPSLYEGSIGPTYYPFAYQVIDNSGREYNFDDQIGSTTFASFTERLRFKTVGRSLYVQGGLNGATPPITVYVHLALEDDVWDFLFDGEMVRKYNEEILQEAITLMDRTIQEGLRLETILSTDDQVPGDLT